MPWFYLGQKSHTVRRYFRYFRLEYPKQYALSFQLEVSRDLNLEHIQEKYTIKVTWLYAYLMGEGDGTPLQYFCLENPMDGGAC